jgi:aspartyl-tRNA(Asn)/glutamyl-tRNA(Gln) amidotransferase subunit A
LQTIAGKDPLDGTTGNVEVPDYRAALTGNVKGMKIGLPREYFIDGLNAEVEAAVVQAASVLKSMGAELVEISLPHTKYAIATYYVITPCEVSSNMARYDGIRYGHTVKDAENLVDYYHQARSEGFGPEVKRRIMIGTYALSAGYFDAYYRQAQKVRTLLKNEFDEAFKQVDVILSPTSPTPAFKVGAHADDPVAMYLEDVFLCAQPMAGIPALALPCGLSKDGLPIGLQLMGPHWGEPTILRAAHAYEQATDWHTKKPTI